MLKEDYINAYEQVRADEDSIERIMKNAYEKKNKNIVQKLRPIVVMMIAVFAIILGTQIPAYAEVYIPENAAVSKDGVVMKVEKVRFHGRELVVDVSFANEAGADFVNGETEYDWGDVCVEINDVKAHNTSFDILKYDEEEGKLYVRYEILRHTAKIYVGAPMKISVNGMCISRNWQETFDVTVKTNPATREVKLPVGLFESDIVKTESKAYPYMVSVLDETPLSEINPDKAAITGAAYMDGMLRVQVCYGESKYFKDGTKIATLSRYEDGKEIFPTDDEQIHWYEQIDDKWVMFMEYYYIVSEEKAKTFPMVLDCYETEGLRDTVWEVDFIIEK